MNKVSQQELSRLAELAVEAELTKRGWLVGNFNASIKNAAVYDLFAVKNNFKCAFFSLTALSAHNDSKSASYRFPLFFFNLDSISD